MRQMFMSFCQYNQDGRHAQTGKKVPEMQVFKYHNFRQ